MRPRPRAVPLERHELSPCPGSVKTGRQPCEKTVTDESVAFPDRSVAPAGRRITKSQAQRDWACWPDVCFFTGMERCPTLFGDLPVTGLVDRYPDGSVKAVYLGGPVSLATSAGVLCPQHTINDSRRQNLPPLTFFPNGQIRSLPLEHSTLVTTPIGEVPAELVTFHDNGALARVFPLNGKLSGYWTEADEAALATPLTVPLAMGPLSARFVAIAFDAAGNLRSLTLWPDEEVLVPTPVGELPARQGISLAPDGSLRSLEPARPVPVPTPVGSILAYDPDAVGISGDANSLVFSPDGAVAAVSTIRTAVTATLADGTHLTLAPSQRESLCGDSEHEPVALHLHFFPDRLETRATPAAAPTIVPVAGTTFATRPHIAAFAAPSAPRRCAG